ncbi:MAG TPA: hypothetical protein VFK86_07260 [Bauldia sp.]|nr:hypothetical protein [Bauldia sp.]
MTAREGISAPAHASPARRSPVRRLSAYVLAYAAAAPFVFFIFFLIRGGWLAISVALMTFPSSLIWLALNSLPQGAALGALVGLVPERWPRPAAGAFAFLLGAAMTMANSLWLGLALVGTPSSAANLVAVGVIGGTASLLLAPVLWYALGSRGPQPA